MLRATLYGALLVLMVTVTPAFGAKQFTVFWLDQQYEPKVNLKTLGPLSPGMRAIFALYAMRASTGCESADENGDTSPRYQCKLTSALNLGTQCSKQQLELVRAWFKNGIPPLTISKNRIGEVLKSGDLRWLCNEVPDTATHRSMWEIIRVEPREDLVTVYATGSWTEGPGAATGKFRYVTVYRIGGDTVDIVSHKELPTALKRR